MIEKRFTRSDMSKLVCLFISNVLQPIYHKELRTTYYLKYQKILPHVLIRKKLISPEPLSLHS